MLLNMTFTYLQTSLPSGSNVNFHFPYNKSKFLAKFNKDASKYLRTEFFFGLVDWQLIATIPNIIHSPYITLDPSILLVYYVILYSGWLMSGKSPQETSFAEKMYARCLTLWRKHEPKEDNRILRLVGSVWMVRLFLTLP